MSTNKKTHWRVVTPVTWPVPSVEMSVSTYADIDECPRRWALSAADYPEIWSGRGYPQRVQVPAMAGSVVHLALEIITKQLVRVGVVSLGDSSAPQVLRELGGYTRVVEECIERILKRHTDNPRAIALMEYAQRTLRAQVPTLRTRVQSMLSRVRLPKADPRTSASPKPGGARARLPLANGAYPEVELRAKSIGWKGKVDLLVLGDDGCTITDFKTGTADEAHKFQVRAYAVMWKLDDELNPTGRLVDRILLAYESKDVDVVPPSAAEADDLSRKLAAYRGAAEAAIAGRPPSARPSSESCRYCGVRQLCDDYWASTSHAVSDDGRFGDIELKITARHGPLSWDATVVTSRDFPTKASALLRIRHRDEFEVGTVLRVLDGALTRDVEDQSAPVVVTLSAMSETYEAPRRF